MLSLKTSTAMELLPVVCLCLLTRCGITSADGNGPTIVKVEEDRDVILPCSLSTKENIESKLFDWRKAAQEGGKKEVFYYNAGEHYNNGYPGQSEEFKGRVFHFSGELKHGNASITIRNTKLTDSGHYTCDFPNLGSRQTFPIELVVDCVLKDRTPDKKPGTCPKPNLRILGPTEGGMLLQCEVKGASPIPKVELKDSSGKILPAEDPVVLPGGGDLYDITLRATVTKTDNYSCVSTQEEICHQISAYTHVPVNVKPVIKVFEGHAAPLPCLLSTEQNIEAEMFEWKKDGQKEVFFHGGIYYNSNRPGQSKEFKGRVIYLQEGLKHGDASITIENVKMSDRGDYTCDFPRLQPHQIFHVKLVVVEKVNPGSGASSHCSDQTFRKVMMGVAVGVLAKCFFL